VVTINGGSVTFPVTQHLQSLTINGPGAAIMSGPDKLLVVSTISFSASGTLDLADSDMIVTGMSRLTVEPLVAAGRGASGNWLGTGINSSVANTFTGSASRALGVIAAADGGYDVTGFAGETVNAADVLVKYTYSGDANLDGSVNFDDFNKFLAGYSSAVANPPRWYTGDFDYNAVVNFDDFNKFLAGYNYFNATGQVSLAFSDFATAEGILGMEEFAQFAEARGDAGPLLFDATPAPEPGGLAVLGVLASGALIRRRRRA
jgi:hypothetical protein